MSTRVVQWATGTTGRLALRAVIEEPGLELVGVRVYDPAKRGQDAGDLCGVARTGIVATDDKDAVLDVHPDLVLYMGSVEKYREECIADVVDLLTAGIDVIATGSSFIEIRAFDPEVGRAIEAASAAGSSTFLGLGLFPGFWGEAIAPALSRLSFRCDRIVVRESLSYAGYPSREMMFDVMGYGRTPELDEAVLGDISRGGLRVHRHRGDRGQGARARGRLGRALPGGGGHRHRVAGRGRRHTSRHHRRDEARGPCRLRTGRRARRARHLDGPGRRAGVVSSARATRSSSTGRRRCAATSCSAPRARTTPRWAAWRRPCTRSTRSRWCAAPPGVLDLADTTGFVGRLR